MSDVVNHPDHYCQGGIECIEAIKASMSFDAFCGYLKGNNIKYLWRYEHKSKRVEDLKKAQWYQNRLIKEVEDDEIKRSTVHTDDNAQNTRL